MLSDYQKHRMQHILAGRPEKVKKQKPIPKYSEKGLLKKEQKKTLLKTDMALYMEIWQERRHEDFETGQPIKGKPVLANFHHVLEKSENNLTDYSIYRHCKWNIVIVSKDTHNQVHSNIDLCPKIKALRLQLEKAHEQGILKANE